jgi:hypothetical protein
VLPRLSGAPGPGLRLALDRGQALPARVRLAGQAVHRAPAFAQRGPPFGQLRAKVRDLGACRRQVRQGRTVVVGLGARGLAFADLAPQARRRFLERRAARRQRRYLLGERGLLVARRGEGAESLVHGRSGGAFGLGGLLRLAAGGGMGGRVLLGAARPVGQLCAQLG